MSSKSFENFGAIARQDHLGDVEVAGRYAFQADAEARIVPDVAEKLALRPDDALLEIGCGPGNLLLPLSARVAAAAGIDNAAALARLQARAGAERIALHPGDFLALDFGAARFSKVLVYSVIQYLDGPETVRRFLLRALALLRPGGRLLLGDLPNRDRKRRFNESEEGMKAAREWQALVEKAGVHPAASQPADDRLVVVDDALVLLLMEAAREAGFAAQRLAQPADLPFGNTREDLLFLALR